VGVTDGVLVLVGVEVIVDVRVGVLLRVGVGVVIAEAVMVRVEVAIRVGVWIRVNVADGVKVRVLSTGWKGVLVAGPGRIVAVAIAVSVTDGEVGKNCRNGESSDGLTHPVRSRQNSNQGKTDHLFMIIPSLSYRKVIAG
jgi:hypothetical protein